jgi:hypothetical protein
MVLAIDPDVLFFECPAEMLDDLDPARNISAASMSRVAILIRAVRSASMPSRYASSSDSNCHYDSTVGSALLITQPPTGI